MDFREFYKLTEQGLSWAPLGMVIPNTNAFGALPAQVTGSEWPDEPLRSGGYMGTDWVNGKFDLMMPGVTKTAQIKHINEKKNPILIFLNDGTKLYIPFDTFRKINARPEVGRTMMVTFQRRTDDTSPVQSIIKTIKCY